MIVRPDTLTLFDASDVRGRARRSDPDTARQAARRPRGGLRHRILACYRIALHGLTDDELAAILSDALAASVKTARSSLARDGFLADSGETRLSNVGASMIVWRLCPRPVETLPPL